MPFSTTTEGSTESSMDSTVQSATSRVHVRCAKNFELISMMGCQLEMDTLQESSEPPTRPSNPRVRCSATELRGNCRPIPAVLNVTYYHTDTRIVRLMFGASLVAPIPREDNLDSMLYLRKEHFPSLVPPVLKPHPTPWAHCAEAQPYKALSRPYRRVKSLSITINEDPWREEPACPNCRVVA